MRTVRPQEIVDRSLAAYNRRDLDAFVACFDEAAELTDLRSAAITMRGRADIAHRYGELFMRSPGLHAHLVHRSVVGDLVSDHELVIGRIGGDVEFLVTYEVVDGLIRRVWSTRGEPLPPLEIRAAGVDDTAAVVEVGRLSYEEHFADIWSTAGLEGFLHQQFAPDVVAGHLSSADTTYLIGALDRGDAGFAKLRWNRPVPLGGNGIGAELQKLYVRRAALDGRVGVRLLVAALVEADARDQPLMWLDVLTTNTGAARFYTRHGFQTVGEREFVTDLTAPGLFVMVRPGG